MIKEKNKKIELQVDDLTPVAADDDASLMAGGLTALKVMPAPVGGNGVSALLNDGVERTAHKAERNAAVFILNDVGDGLRQDSRAGISGGGGNGGVGQGAVLVLFGNKGIRGAAKRKFTPVLELTGIA